MSEESSRPFITKNVLPSYIISVNQKESSKFIRRLRGFHRVTIAPVLRASPWSAPPCRRFGRLRPDAALLRPRRLLIKVESVARSRRQAPAGQSADKAPHSKE